MKTMNYRMFIQIPVYTVYFGCLGNFQAKIVYGFKIATGHEHSRNNQGKGID